MDNHVDECEQNCDWNTKLVVSWEKTEWRLIFEINNDVFNWWR